MINTLEFKTEALDTGVKSFKEQRPGIKPFSMREIWQRETCTMKLYTIVKLTIGNRYFVSDNNDWKVHILLHMCPILRVGLGLALGWPWAGLGLALGWPWVGLGLT